MRPDRDTRSGRANKSLKTNILPPDYYGFNICFQITKVTNSYFLFICFFSIFRLFAEVNLKIRITP